MTEGIITFYRAAGKAPDYATLDATLQKPGNMVYNSVQDQVLLARINASSIQDLSLIVIRCHEQPMSKQEVRRPNPPSHERYVLVDGPPGSSELIYHTVPTLNIATRIRIGQSEEDARKGKPHHPLRLYRIMEEGIAATSGIRPYLQLQKTNEGIIMLTPLIYSADGAHITVSHYPETTTVVISGRRRYPGKPGLSPIVWRKIGTPKQDPQGKLF